MIGIIGVSLILRAGHRYNSVHVDLRPRLSAHVHGCHGGSDAIWRMHGVHRVSNCSGQVGGGSSDHFRSVHISADLAGNLLWAYGSRVAQKSRVC